MTRSTLPGRLSGRTVFLAASVPDSERHPEYLQIADAPFQIEQAVVSLARAVFSEGGRLVFGGHPSISPLVAMVAGEYREPLRAEEHEERPVAQVAIYQSEAFREVIPHDTDLLIRMGLAEEHWIPAVDGERFVRGKGSGGVQCPLSLKVMRERMIDETRPAAMVCIGGMEGVEAEVRLFGKRGIVFTLARTGGAAAILSQEAADVIAVDEVVLRDLRSRDTEFSGFRDLPREGDIEVIPFPLIMQSIVDHIAEGEARL